ncbi:MAG: hypothetical protein Aurels2KO_38170 [Aureliella sp.]
MNILAEVLLYLWPFAVLGLHIVFKPEQAAVLAYVAGWVWLPLITIDIPGLPPYGKFTATSIGMIPCMLIFGLTQIAALRPSWADIPILLWIIAPLPSSLTNGLGLSDGLSGAAKHFLEYGIPYFAGRIYLRDEREWIFLSKAIACCALFYLPLCLFEMRMSPTLHQFIFGYVGRSSFETNSLFGPLKWAPTVFMNSAFEVSMLMVIATLVVFVQLRRAPTQDFIFCKPIWFAVIMFAAVVLCKKWSGLGMLGFGVVTLTLSELLKSRIWAITLVLVPVSYMVVFTLGVWRLEGVSDVIARVSPRRAESFQYRIDNDSRLVDKAMQRPSFGWGGWGRSRIYDETGKDISVTDSAYGIYLGNFGLFGLISCGLLYVLPFLAFLYRNPIENWLVGNAIYVTPFAMVVALHTVDNLFNAFPGVVYPFFAGGVSAFAHQPSSKKER